MQEMDLIMKALITRRTIIIASAALLIALISIISVNVFNSAGPVTGVANTVTRPVRALASSVARTFGNIYAAIYRYTELENRNEELLRDITQLQADARDSIALAEENDRLRAALNMRDRYEGFNQVMATLEGWNSDNWSSSFNINIGYANSDIARGMPVATEYGVLIGQVSDVGATTSTVITVLDTTFSVAVYVGGESAEDSDGTATARGDFAQMRSGLLTIDHIDDGVAVTPGATIVTSGYGGIFPPGLTVGEVVRVFTHSSGIGRYATVMPMRDIGTITTVFVIIDFENPESPGDVEYEEIDSYSDTDFDEPDDFID